MQSFSRWGQSCTTGVFEKDGRILVFVPGNTVILGWEQFAVGLNEENLEELKDVFEEYEFKETPEAFILEGMAPVRQVTVQPMIVSCELEEIGWEQVSFGDARLLEHPDWLEEFRILEHTNCRSFNLAGRVRFDYIDGEWKSYLYHEISYLQLKELLHSQGYALPTADEWAYLCGGGCRTLFPWGDGIGSDMHLLYFEDQKKKGMPYDMKEPNFFGLSIAFDPYKREVVEANTLTTCGGDGGCNICGGMGLFLGFLPCSPHWKPEVQEEDILDNDFDFCRPIIRIET